MRRPPSPVPVRLRTEGGFSLLEIMVALAILVSSLLILVGAQNYAVIWYLEAERMTVATQLAEDVISLAELRFELEGFGNSDIEETGDFGSGPWKEYDDQFDDYRWKYSLQRVTIDSGMVSNLMELQGGEEDGVNTQDEMTQEVMGQLGFGPELFTEVMSEYLRMLTVEVYYRLTETSETEEVVRLVTHIANPSGRSLEQEEQSEALSEMEEEMEDSVGFGTALESGDGGERE